jgi:hypothetical protein
LAAQPPEDRRENSFRHPKIEKPPQKWTEEPVMANQDAKPIGAEHPTPCAETARCVKK